MKKLFLGVLMFFALTYNNASFSAGSTSCANYSNGICTYTKNAAIQYALNYVETTTSFPDYTSLGGNCTNFVSQAVLSGLIGNSDKNYVYNRRDYYLADRDKGCMYCWYYHSTTSYGPSWKGAHEFYDYVNNNLLSYWGMHFDPITHDSPTQYMDTSKVQTGDIIFADWENDGFIDHTMIVTDKTANSYAGIKVSYQNSDGYLKRKNRPLSEINGYYSIFYVYRPTFYRN